MGPPAVHDERFSTNLCGHVTEGEVGDTPLMPVQGLELFRNHLPEAKASHHERRGGGRRESSRSTNPHANDCWSFSCCPCGKHASPDARLDKGSSRHSGHFPQRYRHIHSEQISKKTESTSAPVPRPKQGLPSRAKPPVTPALTDAVHVKLSWLIMTAFGGPVVPLV